MSDEQLIVGLPAGSLADPNRGGSLNRLLHDAGFPTKGYDRGGPSTFTLTPFLLGWDGRPQEFGAQLALGEVDVAIGGDDWVKERMLEFKYEYGQEIELDRVLELDRGKVRLVVIADTDGEQVDVDAWLTDLLKAKTLVTIVSELPYLTLDYFKQKADALGFGESHSAFSVQKYGSPAQIEAGALIYEAWGKTEAKVTNGAADFGVEITQTGSSIRNYGLSILDTVMESQAGVWASPKLRDDETKYDLARLFLLNVYGSVYAENKVIVTFNAKKTDVTKLIDYLGKNHLFGDEPTMNEGINYTEFTIQLDYASKTLPIARVRYELAKIGATHIETIPLESSIPGLDVLDF